MAQVPSLPSNGQPIDTQYIYDIVNSLISINSAITTVGSSNVKIGTVPYPTVNTSNLNVDAQSINIITSQPVDPKNPLTGFIPFKTTFTQTPVVTATLVSKNTTNVNATVTITGVDSSAVYYKVVFTDKGTTTVDLNIIAVGV
jgi:hypothetical protein